MPTHAFDIQSDGLLNDIASQMTLDDLCIYCLKGRNSTHCNEEIFALNYKTAKQLRLLWMVSSEPERSKIYTSPNISSIPFDIRTQLNLKLKDDESVRGAFHGLTEHLNAGILNSGILNSLDFIRRGFRAKSLIFLKLHRRSSRMLETNYVGDKFEMFMIEVMNMRNVLQTS